MKLKVDRYMKISVLGCGRWGTFIAWYLNKIGNDVLIWGRSSSKNFLKLKNTRKNSYLSLPDNIKLTNDLDEALSYSDIIVISIGSQALRNLMQNAVSFNIENKVFVLCMKGIEVSSGKRLTEVMEEFIPENSKTAIWVGPGHVEDFVRGIPNCMVIDSENEEIKNMLVRSFSSDLIRFYYGTDLIGNEIGAAAKNVVGIAAGMLDGLEYSSLKGALMSRGTREIARLIKAAGGNEISAYGLSHLGDYEATLFSEHSHNRKFGEMYIKGEDYDKLAEGVFTVKALLNMADKYGVELPISDAVNKIINLKKDPKKILSNLFVRSIKREF